MNSLFKPHFRLSVPTRTGGFILASLFTATLHSASAATIYSTGFENPPFASGSPLVGQDGWTGVPFLSPNAAIISTAAAQSGLQGVQVRGADMVNAVEVDPIAAVGSFRKALNYDTAASGLSIVTFQASVRLDGPVIGTGDFFSANIGARSGDGSVGELSISSDGMVYGYKTGTLLGFSAPITLNAWHTLGIIVDFAADTYTFSVDGTLSSAFAFDAGFTSDVLLRESLITYAFPDTATNHRSDFTASYDNLTTTAVVPEPASGAMLAFGGVALLSRRRRVNRN